MNRDEDVALCIGLPESEPATETVTGTLERRVVLGVTCVGITRNDAIRSAVLRFGGGLRFTSIDRPSCRESAGITPNGRAKSRLETESETETGTESESETGTESETEAEAESEPDAVPALCDDPVAARCRRARF